MSENLFDRFFKNIAEPAKVVMSVDGGRDRTYADIVAESGRLANVLTSRRVVAGDRVAVQVEKSPEALILYLATVRAGGGIL